MAYRSQLQPGQQIATFSWKQDLAKAASSNAFVSTSTSNFARVPNGTPMYLRVQMTGGGGKLASTNTNYPLMMVVTETPPVSGTNAFKRFYPFPGTPGFGFTTAIIPLLNVTQITGLAPKFSVDVYASSGGTDAHSSANGNQGELWGEVITGPAIESEVTTICRSELSGTYTTNQICFTGAWRRASSGSFLVSTGGDTLGYRIKSFGHIGHHGVASEPVNNITSSTTTSAATLGWAAAWGTNCTIEGFASGADITTRALSLIGTVTGGLS